MVDKIEEKDLQVMKGLEDAIMEMGLSIIPNDSPECVESCLEGENYHRSVFAVYESSINLIRIEILNGDLPGDRTQQLLRVINIINNRLMTCHYRFEPKLDIVVLSAGFYVEDNFEKDAFKRFLNNLLAHSLHYGLLLELVHISNDETIDRWQDYLLSNTKGEINE